MAGYKEKRGNGWRLTAYGGYRDGKQIKHRKTIGPVSPQQADKQLAKWVAEVERMTTHDPDHLTFENFCERWLRDYAEVSLAPRTVNRYKELLAKILSAIGHLKLNKIAPTHIIEYESSLRKDGARNDGKEGGLGERTIMHHHRLMSTIFQTAVYWQLLDDNPVKKIKAPTVSKKHVKSFTQEQMLQIIEGLEEAPIKHRVAILLGLGTGLRIGEILALKWSEIDLDQGILTVNHTLLYIPNQELSLTKPKTEESKRQVAIPSSIIPAIKEYKLAQSKYYIAKGIRPEIDLVFATEKGGFMYPSTITRWFKKFLKKRSLPEIGFHGLRHTYCTLLLDNGLPTVTVSGSAGHSRPSTTTDIYYSYLKKVNPQTALEMDKLMQKK